MKKTIFTIVVLSFITLLMISGCDIRTGSNMQEIEKSVVDTPESVKLDTMEEAESGTPEEGGFSTPEEAVLSYLAALRDLDFSNMMNAFAIENYKYDLETALSQMKIFTTWTQPLPNVNNFVSAINTENRRFQVVTIISLQTIYLRLSADRRADIFTIVGRSKTEVGSPAFIDEVRQSLSNTPSSELKVYGFIPIESLSQYTPEFLQEEYQLKAAQIGAESITGCAAMFGLDRDMFLFCPDVVNYEGKWYIENPGGLSASSVIIGTDTDDPMLIRTIGIIPVPDELLEDYNAMLVPVKTEATNKKSEPLTAEGEGFDTSEAAVAAYLTAFKNSDLARMIDSFAIESYVKNCYYSQPLSPFFHDENGFTYKMSVEARRSYVASVVCFSYRYLCLSDIENVPDPDWLLPTGNNLRITIDTGGSDKEPSFLRWLSDLIENIPLNEINILGFVKYESLMDSILSEENLEQIKMEENGMVEVLGADMVNSCIVVFEIGEDKYLLCPMTVCYGNKWYMYELSGTVLSALQISTNSNSNGMSGGILPITNEFYDLIIQ